MRKDMNYTPYNETLNEIKTLLDVNPSFFYWLLDKEDRSVDLVNRLIHDLEDFNPHTLSLSGRKDDLEKHCRDPWSFEIIPYVDELSNQGIEKAVLLLDTFQIPQDIEESWLREYVRGIDYYYEKAEGKKRFPIILVSPQKYFDIYLQNSESFMPNWGGFFGRVKKRILDQKK